MRKTFILLKDTPEFKKGAIIQEACDDGTQDFICINFKEKMQKASKHRDGRRLTFWREWVIDRPEWFEEIEQMFVPKSKVARVKTYLKKI